MNLCGAHAASLTGTHAREAGAPCRALTCTYMYMFMNILRTRICVCIYLGFLGRTRCAAASAAGPVIHVHTGVYIHIYALVYVCAYNGSSREPGRLTRVTTSPHGSHGDSQVVSSRSHDVGRARCAAASLLTRYTHTYRCIYIHIYASIHVCIYRLLTGVTTSQTRNPRFNPRGEKGMRRRELTGPSGPASDSRSPWVASRTPDALGPVRLTGIEHVFALYLLPSR